MNLQKLAEKLLAELEAQIEEMPLTDHPLEQFRTGLAVVQKALTALKLEFGKQEIGSIDDEIYFFKKGKPRIYSWLVFIT